MNQAHRWTGPLWVIWAGLLFGGMILAGFEHIDAPHFLKATHLSSSFVLVLASWLWLAGANFAPLTAPLLLLAIGMTFGFLGDISNAEIFIKNPPAGKGLPLATIGGILTFGLGHIAYMWAATLTARLAGLMSSSIWWGSVLFWQLVGVAGWWWVFHPIRPLEIIHWAALGYSLLLSGTAGVTCALAIQDRRFTWFALGGAAFLASDLVLAFQLFRRDVRFEDILSQMFLTKPSAIGRHFFEQVSRNACWLLYGPAQMMIVYSAASIIRAWKSRAGTAK